MTAAELPLSRRAAAEFVATALLLAAVIGSMAMAQRLAPADAAVRLLANTLATAAVLVALLAAFGPVSGAHLNPAVSAVAALRGELAPREALAYVAAQCAGGVAGAVLAHAMFGLPVFAAATAERAGPPLLLAEGVATFALLATILGCARGNRALTPFAVAGVIAAAYWFTASTSFANPAATLARAFTPTEAGIRPGDAPAFIAVQAAGALLAYAFDRWLFGAGGAATSPGALLATEEEPCRR